jgi:hypothetical protein
MRFQFLGIPPKGELPTEILPTVAWAVLFPISRDPPEGGTLAREGSRMPAREGGCFQFLGIPPKGELYPY